jgi:glycosyltransferase involved in cell wall biosynthesis
MWLIYGSAAVNEPSSESPLVSVVIPTRNRPSELQRALESVAVQAWQDRLEVILVDDGSDPPVRVSAHPDLPLLQIIRNEAPVGAAAARNRGVAVAGGDVIAFLDDDDEWLPGKLDAQWRLLQDPELDFAYCGCELHTEGAGRRGVVEAHSDPETLFDELLLRDIIVMPSLLVRRTLFERVRGFDERFPAANDWDFCLRMAQAGRGAGVPQNLVRAYQRPGRSSISTDLSAFLEGRRLLLQKHAEALAGRRGAQARHHLHIAQSLALGGSRAEARREVRAALRSGGMFWNGIYQLIAIHLPRWLYARMGRLIWRFKGLG